MEIWISIGFMGKKVGKDGDRKGKWKVSFIKYVLYARHRDRHLEHIV